MAVKLVGCPLDGEAADSYGNGNFGVVYCTKCGLELKRYGHNAQERAVADWNNRVTLESLVYFGKAAK